MTFGHILSCRLLEDPSEDDSTPEVVIPEDTESVHTGNETSAALDEVTPEVTIMIRTRSV